MDLLVLVRHIPFLTIRQCRHCSLHPPFLPLLCLRLSPILHLLHQPPAPLVNAVTSHQRYMSSARTHPQSAESLKYAEYVVYRDITVRLQHM
jgi:hypothetical protein